MPSVIGKIGAEGKISIQRILKNLGPRLLERRLGVRRGERKIRVRSSVTTITR